MTGIAVAPADNVSADPVLDDAQKAVDAHEAGKVTEPVAEPVKEPVKADEPAKEPDKKDDKPRDESGKFAPDYSKVTLPKDALIDATALERTTAIARELGLSREQAQATVDLVNEQVVASRAALLAAHQPGGAEWTKQLDAWKAQTLADPSLGKTPEERKASIDLGASVLKKYAAAEPEESQGIMTFLNDSGLGEHPAVAKFFRWLGKAAGERPISLGSDASIAGDARTFFPNSDMNP